MKCALLRLAYKKPSPVWPHPAFLRLHSPMHPTFRHTKLIVSPGAASPSASLPLLRVFVLVWHKAHLYPMTRWSVTLVKLFLLKAGSCRPRVLVICSYFCNATSLLDYTFCLFAPGGQRSQAEGTESSGGWMQGRECPDSSRQPQ